MTPSTNAAAGAFLISSLMPQAWRTMRRSKSRYFSNIKRASSISLPELSTASAHLRNKGYRPPWPESRSLAISCCDRCSKLPLGATRASTISDDRIEVSTQHLFLWVDIDRNIVLRAHPHFDHVGIRQRDAAIGPVVRRIVRRRMLWRVRKSVDHDRAAGSPAIPVRALLILLIGVGDLNGKKKFAAGIAPRQKVTAFRSSEIPLALLLSYRTQPQRHLVFAHQLAAAVQIQFMFRLVHDHPVGDRDVLGAGNSRRGRRAHRQN